MPLLLNLLIAAQAADAQSPPVAIVRTSSDIAAALESEMGAPVRVSPKLAKNLVLVARNGASPTKVLAALAQALNADTVSSGSGYRIEASEATVGASRNREIQRRKEWIETRIKMRKEYAEGTIKGGEESVAIFGEVERMARASAEVTEGKRESPDAMFPSELLPAHELLLGLIERIGIEKIAAVPVNEFEVWENAPVFGVSDLPRYQDLLNSYQTRIEALRANPIPDSVRAGFSATGMSGFFKDWDLESPPPTKLRVRVISQQGLLGVTLSGFDASGKEKLFAGLSARPVKVFRSPLVIAAEKFRDQKSVWQPVSPSFTVALKSFGRARTQPPEWFVDPVAHEPMNAFVAEALGRLAVAEGGKCVAFRVCDDLWDDVRYSLSGDRLNLDALRSLLDEWSDYERVEKDGSVIWRPRRTLAANERQTSRAALASLVQSASKGRVDVRTVARFRETAGPDQTRLSQIWEAVYRSNPKVSTYSGDVTDDFYRVMGGIPDDLWARLTRGEPMKIGGLGVRAQFDRMLRNEYTPVTTSTPVSDLLRHPLEAFANADASEAVMTMTTNTEELLGIATTNPDGTLTWAMEVADWDPRTPPEKILSYLRSKKYQKGTQREVVVSIRLPHGLYQRGSFKDPIELTSGIMEYDKLPEKLRLSLFKQASSGGSGD